MPSYLAVLDSNETETTFSVALPACCARCGTVHSGSKLAIDIKVSAIGRQVAAGILVTSILNFQWPDMSQDKTHVRDVLIEWQAYFNPVDIIAYGDPEFRLDETKALMKQAIKKLATREADSSGTEAKQDQGRFLCDVLLAFEKDMKKMKVMWQVMSAKGDDFVRVAPYNVDGMEFYMPRDEKGTDADDGALTFMRSTMVALAKLYVVWKRVIPAPGSRQSEQVERARKALCPGCT
ncbi:hypothetical protein DL765_010451 [Monosporascus sp. GIB2]|nr:hypothetical protein DL765_010451 [Monosporascus sp. GIB2]